MQYCSISEILKLWRDEVKYKYSIHYRYVNGILTICTEFPYYLIGVGGELIYKYKNILEENFSDFIDVELIQTYEL